MSLRARFGAYIFNAIQAIKAAEQVKTARAITEGIDDIIKDVLQDTFLEMAQTVDEAQYSGEIETESSYFASRSDGYIQYRPLAESTVERKSYLGSDGDMEMPLKYMGFYHNDPDALSTVLTRMSHESNLAEVMFDAFGGVTTKTVYEDRILAVNEKLYNRRDNKRKTTRTRWRDVVDPKVVEQVRQNANRYTYVRGTITTTGFYDAIRGRHISLERAIAEGRVKHHVKIAIDFRRRLFVHVDQSEWGFTNAMIPIIAKESQDAADKVEVLMNHNQRNFIDIFFSGVFEKIARIVQQKHPTYFKEFKDL